eukprot:SAG22_NODE_8013_length_691_cov_0.778716_2_plen_77_part_00
MVEASLVAGVVIAALVWVVLWYAERVVSDAKHRVRARALWRLLRRQHFDETFERAFNVFVSSKGTVFLLCFHCLAI